MLSLMTECSRAAGTQQGYRETNNLVGGGAAPCLKSVLILLLIPLFLSHCAPHTSPACLLRSGLDFRDMLWMGKGLAVQASTALLKS